MKLLLFFLLALPAWAALPPMPVKFTASVTVPQRKPKPALSPKDTLARGVQMDKNKIPRRFKTNSTHKVIYGNLPNAQVFRAAGSVPAKDLLHMDPVIYERAVPVYWPADDEVVISDTVTWTANQEGGFGVVMEDTDNLIDWAEIERWGMYPDNQKVTITWVRRTATVDLFYPHIFVRAYKTVDGRTVWVSD